jgi:uncharacterized protein
VTRPDRATARLVGLLVVVLLAAACTGSDRSGAPGEVGDEDRPATAETPGGPGGATGGDPSGEKAPGGDAGGGQAPGGEAGGGTGDGTGDGGSQGSDADPSPDEAPRAEAPPTEAPPTEVPDHDAAGTPPQLVRFPRSTLMLATASGSDLALPVWVANTPDRRAQGLMEVTDLPADAGMIFLFPESTTGGFWMRNTRIPLSIAFFTDEGALVDVLDMEPCTADPCEVYRPRGAYRYAIEVNQGWFARNGIGAGATLRLPPDLPPAS